MAYLCSGLVIPYIQVVRKRSLIIFGIFFESLGLLMMGPSAFLGIHQNVWVMGAGQVLAGLVLPMILIPSLPEMIDIVDYYYEEASFK